MLTYRAMYKHVEGAVHAEVLDFPGVITWGHDLAEARELLAGGLVEMADWLLTDGEPLPTPDPTATSEESDLEEPIHLYLSAGTAMPETASEPTGATGMAA